MKRKAAFRKIEVKNKSFLEAIKSSSGETEKIHLENVLFAKKSGLLSKLVHAK